VGEIYLGGAGVARGYQGRSEQTSERFVPHPYSARAGSRLYRTGDLGRYRGDGELEYVGWLDEQVKVHGYRIEPGEVEAALSRHAQVSQALVTTYAEGGGEGRLVAYVVSDAGGEVTGAELREYLRAKLPEYMIPAYFVELEELPLSPNGKVDRGALPPPERSRAGLEKEYVGPRSRLEELLAEMWKEVLKLEAVGVHDNFFELGGDSIHSAIFINHLQERLGEYVYIVAIFDAPTIAGLAEYLERHYGEAVARVCGLEPSEQACVGEHPQDVVDGLVRHRCEPRPSGREQGLGVRVRVVVHGRQHGLARRGDAQRSVAQETLDVPRVLHDTDPTTKTGLDQIQNTDRVANSSRLAARRRASRKLGPTAAGSIAAR